MLYRTESWAIKNQHENKASVAEIEMLHWIYGKTKRNNIINENIIESFEVIFIVEKLVENILRWFGHVESKHVDSIVRRVNQMKMSQTNGGRRRLRKTNKLLRKILRLMNWIETWS